NLSDTLPAVLPPFVYYPGVLLGGVLAPCYFVWQLCALADSDLATELLGFFLASALIAAIVICGCVVFAGACILLTVWIHTAGPRQHPEAVVTDKLLTVLALLKLPGNVWLNPGARRHLLTTLETCAVCLQEKLPRRLRGGDLATSYWWNDKAARMAAALR